MTNKQIKKLRRSTTRLPGIFWRIFAISQPTLDDGPLVRLEWGWSAGQTDKQLRKFADDCPMGHASVITNLSCAKMLRDDLTSLIKKIEGESKLREVT